MTLPPVNVSRGMPAGYSSDSADSDYVRNCRSLAHSLLVALGAGQNMKPEVKAALKLLGIDAEEPDFTKPPEHRRTR